jgi:hypothetical protein
MSEQLSWVTHILSWGLLHQPPQAPYAYWASLPPAGQGLSCCYLFLSHHKGDGHCPSADPEERPEEQGLSRASGDAECNWSHVEGCIANATSHYPPPQHCDPGLNASHHGPLAPTVRSHTSPDASRTTSQAQVPNIQKAF